MKRFHIAQPDLEIQPRIRQKIDNLTKPKGSLGRLESLALQVATIQQTLHPTLRNPHNVIFAADHGIVQEGVSLTPKEVTYQQVIHFTQGGAGINFLCRQHGFKLIVVDAGVDYDFDPALPVINAKTAYGTRNFLYTDAMTPTQMEACIAQGAKIVDQVAEADCNVLSIGEMGAGNTSPASIWMSLLTHTPMEQCIGAGSGLDSAGIRHKRDVLEACCQRLAGEPTPERVMTQFGGFEMVMAVGAMLRAAERGMIILVDGFIMTACMLMASRCNPHVTDYAIYSHVGDEKGHKLLLQLLHANPLINLGLRLGEGTGAVCAYPLIDSAVRMINEMDEFKEVAVTKYFS